MLDVWDWHTKSNDEQREYLHEAKEILRNQAFMNEVSRIKNEAGKNIVRSTKVSEEVAWNRGVLYGLEALEQRFKHLAAKNVKK